jgi:hypothetical protein
MSDGSLTRAAKLRKRRTRSEQGNRSHGRPQENEPDVDQGGASKGKVTPLVRANHETSDETGDDHDLVEEDQGDDVRQGESGGEDELEQEAGGGDDPVDVPDIPDLSGVANVVELDIDGSGTEIGRHGEVCLEMVKSGPERRKKISSVRSAGEFAPRTLTMDAVVKMMMLK